MRLLATLSSLALGLGFTVAAAANCGMPGCTHEDHGAAEGHAHEHGAAEGHAHEHGAAEAAPLAAAALYAPYEAMRQLLTSDTAEGLSAPATELAKAARGLAETFDAEAAGVPAAKKDEAAPLLREIAGAAGQVAEAKDLAAAREAFYALSKPLVRYRELVLGGRPVVVYCGMAQKSWLQPDEPIGNPYYGSSMLRCGKVVSR